MTAMIMALMLSTSCVKENAYLADALAELQFSNDTVAFDTVFATMGTATRQVLVYNRYDEPILLTSVTLRNGTASRFRIAVDGDTSMVVRNVRIDAHDSIFIFVQANINPNASSEPFLVEDAVVFDFAGRQQQLPLRAYGRNAVYHVPDKAILNQDGSVYLRYSVIDCANWDHSRPHVIVDYAVVDEGFTLNLTAGDELYFGNDACLWVFEGGCLKVNGTQDQPVLFSSVRHDGWYDSLPGQWGYIWLYSGSINSEIDHALIENGSIGLLVDTNVNDNPTLKITNTVVRNQSLYGIYGSGSYITGDNLLIHSCGRAVMALQNGGRYLFCNSTLANYWHFGSTGNGGGYIVSGASKQSYALAVSNWYEAVTGATVVRDLGMCHFHNCIIDGSHNSRGDGEVMLASNPAGRFEVLFDHCLVKSENCLHYAENSQLCDNPGFKNTKASDFHLQEDSPAIGAGSQSWIAIPYDLDGVVRNVPPTVGAYELLIQ